MKLVVNSPAWPALIERTVRHDLPPRIIDDSLSHTLFKLLDAELAKLLEFSERLSQDIISSLGLPAVFISRRPKEKTDGLHIR